MEKLNSTLETLESDLIALINRHLDKADFEIEYGNHWDIEKFITAVNSSLKTEIEKATAKTMEKFVQAEYSKILYTLCNIVADLKRDMELTPNEFTEYGCEEPSIDIRLCIDKNHWFFRTGSSDFDQYHSELCAGLSVQLDTKPRDLLDELLRQLEF